MTRALIIAAIIIGLCGAIYIKGQYDGMTHLAARHAAQLAEAQAQATRKQTRMMRDVETTAEQYQDALASVAADRDLARTAAGGLRQALAARASRDPRPAACPDGGAVARALAECADQLANVAGVADGYANQLIGLQGYARAIAGE